jgi:rhomboid family GlyGly-CTERM serine protease
MSLPQSSDAANRSILRRSTGWLVPLVLVAFSLMSLLPGASAQQLLRYHRADIAAGEFWRLATGHFVHLGTTHLLLNIAGLAIVWLLIGTGYSQLGWILVAVLSVVLIDLGFWFLDPGLVWYVGMSGLLHALLVAGIISRVGEAPVESTALGLIVAAKITWEQVAGPLPGSEVSAGGPVVVDAHLYGAIAGIIAGMVVGRLSHLRGVRGASI